ncbi:CD83 antigen [Stigmatopora argus]
MKTLYDAAIILLLLNGVCCEEASGWQYVVECDIGQNCSLPCRVHPKAGVQYMYVAWYKVRLFPNSPMPQRRGLLMRQLPDGEAVPYVGLTRETALRYDTRELLLPNIMCDDQGEYACRLQAPVGEIILLESVRLRLAGCPEISIRTHQNNQEITIAVSAAVTIALLLILMSCGIVWKLRQDRKKDWSQTLNPLRLKSAISNTEGKKYGPFFSRIGSICPA